MVNVNIRCLATYVNKILQCVLTISSTHWQQMHLPQLLGRFACIFEQLAVAILDHGRCKYKLPVIRCPCPTF